MIYAISDIHGEYDAYKKLLNKIHFSDEDELFVLGDCVDRGPEPIKVLQDMMFRPNVFPLIGNHEYMALRVLTQLVKEVTLDNCEKILNHNTMQEFFLWQNDGGDTTIQDFYKLSANERNDIIEYMSEFSLYEEISVNGRDFVLVHAGLDNFSPTRDMADYALHELIFNPPDYDRVYFENKTLVTGHLPTINESGNSGQVIIRNNHIAIDCGKVFGGNLAAVCLNTMGVFYI